MAAKSHRALLWIAVFKIIKCVLLLVAAAGALELLKPGAQDGLVEYLIHLPLAQGFRPLDHLIHWLGGLSRHNLELAAGLACAYAALYATEGIGLWRRKRWAEYLTTIATASLIPFEVWELARGASVAKVAALAINVAIVIYLIYVLRSDRQKAH
jgi:uncharacterized membrane protein (DUF2068 family)